MNNPQRIDLSSQKSETEWQHITDNFFLKATPKIYEWLSWVITLAALTYVQHKTKSIYISTTLVITYVFTYFYYITYFYQFLFVGFTFIKKSKLALFVSLILSGLLGYATWFIAREAVNAIAMSQL